jgi:hypothetical protein
MLLRGWLRDFQGRSAAPAQENQPCSMEQYKSKINGLDVFLLHRVEALWYT